MFKTPEMPPKRKKRLVEGAIALILTAAAMSGSATLAKAPGGPKRGDNKRPIPEKREDKNQEAKNDWENIKSVLDELNDLSESEQKQMKEDITYLQKNLKHTNPPMFQGVFYIKYSGFAFEEFSESTGGRKFLSIINNELSGAVAKESEANQAIKVEGVEKIGISEQEMELIFNTVTPLVKRNVGEFKYVGDEQEAPRHKAGGVTGASSTHLPGQRDEISLFAPLKELDKKTNMNVIFHEFGHVLSPTGISGMPLNIRAKFLRATVERAKADDRFISESAEKINDNLLLKTSEYWADLFRDFCADPESIMTNHPKDFEIIKEFVLAQDPEFDPVEAAKERQRLLGD